MKIGLPPNGWDAEIAISGGSMLQSRLWAELQEASSRTVAWDKGEHWAWCGAIHVARGLRYLMVSYGPVARDDAALVTAIRSIQDAGRELGVDFVRVEPQAASAATVLKKMDAVKIGEWQPQHTQVIDLSLSEEALRSAVASGHRNGINGAERRGVTVRQSDDDADLKLFLQMLHETAKRTKTVFFPDTYYYQIWKLFKPVGAAKLFIAEGEGKPVAASLMYDWQGTRIYAHAGAFYELNREYKAAVVLLWEAILDAKATGLREFDLWGVAPENAPKHAWAGLTQFKKGFGGEPRNYAGTWDIPLKRAKYTAYSVYRRVRGRE
jgi:lipid II:glycine glycyltransferase (peptidoglycan interpeptide bridge formation enzyme)